MDLALGARVFLVAGSSRGIGKAIARNLLAEGAYVCITGRDAPSLDDAERDLGCSARLLARRADLGDPTEVADVYDAIAAHFGRLDGLVASVGNGTGTTGWEQPQAEWHRLLQENLLTSVSLARAAVPYLSRNGGSIVFINSIAGREATLAPLAYSAAKAALLSYGKNLAREVASQRIRVNAIAPGNIGFPGGSWERRLGLQPQATRAMLASSVPMERFGTPAEIADLAAFLCSERASFVTGACFVADGGQMRSV